MAPHEDAPQTRNVVQAQPNLEVWPFVTMVQTSHTPTVLTNPHQPDNPIIFANDAFLRLAGYGREEVLGRNCRFLSGPETDPEIRSRVRRAVDDAHPISAKILNYRKDGSRFWNQLHINPIFDEAGILAYFVGYQHDITRQVEAEQALQQARQELEVRLSEREGLIREVHHRVHNNLQTIIGLLNLEARRGDPSLRRQDPEGFLRGGLPYPLQDFPPPGIGNLVRMGGVPVGMAGGVIFRHGLPQLLEKE